ncbi:hypothetical protein [Vulcanisaeta souniana]|uniref:Uncharacterized protein n=1 Tax=Vulcanisaeta souniana JCM 11219 TaxID=1293586 RepID=A0A830EBI9_9CREN|nr:hypothetical protein [Vulcanisaeta souniana]BDR92063.1 hypothetical protein Vsou_11560 [Vulcanisaeta souniana JCM 11219]GGI68161.1 hypothetical protein GCM10007112_01510 [Vulcanisaeta souniana JCM 11219]
MSSTYSECIRLLREVLERLESIEGELDLVKDELRELREQGIKQQSSSTGTQQFGSGLLRLINESLFLDTKDVLSKRLLKRLIDSGRVILLRDESANREVVTTKEIIRRLLSKLPISINEINKLSDREYELLTMLNRLGYVLLRDNKYVISDTAKEFI